MERYILRIPSIDRIVELDREHYTIGRSDSCDIVIKDGTLSRVHAELNLGGEGWTISDCNSTNGLSVNVRRLLPNDVAFIRPGDSIILGPEIELQLTAEEDEDDDRTVAIRTPGPAASPAATAPRPTPPASSPVRPEPSPMRSAPPPMRSAAAGSDSSAVVRAKIEEAVKKGKTLRYVMIGLLALGVVLSVAVHPAAGMVLFMPILIVLLNYLEKYSGICGTVKSMPQAQLDSLLSGSWDTAPRYPTGKVYCGDFAVYSETYRQLIPLENLAWIYLTETKTKAMGITVGVLRSVNFCYRNGNRCACVFDDSEIKDLMENKILPLNPDVLIGFTAENQRAYSQMIR